MYSKKLASFFTHRWSSILSILYAKSIKSIVLITLTKARKLESVLSYSPMHCSTYRLLLNKDHCIWLAFLLKSMVQNVFTFVIQSSDVVDVWWMLDWKKIMIRIMKLLSSLFLWFSVLLILRKFKSRSFFHWSVQRGVGRKIWPVCFSFHQRIKLQFSFSSHLVIKQSFQNAHRWWVLLLLSQQETGSISR